MYNKDLYFEGHGGRRKSPFNYVKIKYEVLLDDLKKLYKPGLELNLWELLEPHGLKYYSEEECDKFYIYLKKKGYVFEEDSMNLFFDVKW
jgi:hypothetical protein